MVIPAVDDETASFEEEVDEFSLSYSSNSSLSFSSSSCSGGRGKMPERLRRRLLEWESRNALISIEDIEAKLRDADLRRQDFYDQLSKKASPKRRSPSQARCSNEELEQRIEARLQAAEEKRLGILANAQKRLARLDELRQAAKTGLEIRQEKERNELSKRVELRFQQAEANRTHMLKRDRLRRASLRERTSQSISRRMARESKYKERVYALIHQKRAAAEKKRVGLLEAEKRRASARFLQVRQVARMVSHQREVERRRLRDEMEHRLQRAKKQRADYLKQRGRANLKKDMMHEQGDILSRKLARCWSHFIQKRKTTVALAKAYDELKINEKNVRMMPFEQLAHLIESRATLWTVKALLDRLESRFRLSISFGCNAKSPPSYVNIDHLLKKVSPPRRKLWFNSSIRRNRKTQKNGPLKEPVKAPEKLSRYQMRLVLCAYMIIIHPDAVFSGQGEREMVLASSAANFTREFEMLVKIVLDGPIQKASDGSGQTVQRSLTFRSQLTAFDSAWCTYLNDFVVWKIEDAESLVQDLVRAACQLELSMMQKCKLTKEGDFGELTDDLEAIKKQVADDQKLLRQKILRLNGEAGMRHLESALSDTRSQYFKEKENGSPSSSPTSSFLLPLSSLNFSTASSSSRSETRENSERTKHVARSLFKDKSSISADNMSSSSPLRKTVDDLYGKKLVTENEIMVNEFVHKQGYPSSNSWDDGQDGGINSFKERLRETMETAFWDGIVESMKQTESNYGQLIELLTEMRDGICEISPANWKEEIHGIIDLVVLSKMLNSGKLDVGLLQKIFEFALITLQKLSAPANDDKIRENNTKLLRELSLICHESDKSGEITAVVKGIRFVLEQIQALKKEIGRAHIMMVESFINGSAGLEYLKSAFSDRYGPPHEAVTHLPCTVEWLSSVRNERDEVWNEHASTLSQNHNQGSSPASILKTGRSVLEERNRLGTVHASKEPYLTGPEQPECGGEIIDSLVRLGVLKLVNGITALNLESLPETLRLNLSRLRKIQGQLQKIVVILTSILVVRQVLLSEPMISSLYMEKLLPRLTEQLSRLLGTDKDVGMEEISIVINGYLEEFDQSGDLVKLQSRKELVARMLVKSLQAGDPVFKRVSRAIYKATRGVVLGGTGPRGRELAKVELQKMGAAPLINEVVEAAKPTVAVATISVRVHGDWYANLVKNNSTRTNL